MPLPPSRRGRSPFDDIMHEEVDPDRGPFQWWSARELQGVLGYPRWESFQDAIERAKHACRNTSGDVLDHFRDATKMVGIGSGAARPIEDVQLSRLGCYFVAMNGDPRKSEIAAAQQYFAIQTYRAEKALPPPHEPLPPQPVHPQLARPWATRFSMTFGDHYRHVYMTHPAGAFSVITAGLMQMMVLEDQLLMHLMPVRSGDRPCISIGRTWSVWVQENDKGRPIGDSPLYLPDQNMTVPVYVYGGELRVVFDYWLHNIYLQTKLHPYIDRKKEFQPCGALPRASVAHATAMSLTGRAPALPSRIAVELENRGGFVPNRVLPAAPPPGQLGQ